MYYSIEIVTALNFQLSEDEYLVSYNELFFLMAFILLIKHVPHPLTKAPKSQA